MAGPWIDARDALSVLNDPFVICERLHAGLIESRARLFKSDADAKENFAIPRAFWWARGHEALEQNWDAGDFSTWLDGKLQLSAFGVQFELSGVLEALPDEQRGGVAARFSVTGNSAWISANNSVSLIAPETFRPARQVEDRIIEAARLGFVAAKAVEARAATHGFDNWHWWEREWSVPTWFWEHYTGYDTSTRSFELDTMRGYGKGPIAACMQLDGVHSLLSDLQRHFSLPSAPSEDAGASTAVEQQRRATSKGGRPPLAFNDELICAIWALIYQGDLMPSRQADVERAILDWASANGHDLSETTARAKARMIYSALNREVENPSRN